jgi:C1A family cysteine protease
MRNRTGEARIQGAPTVADASDTTTPARERQYMTTTRRTVLALAVAVLASLCALPQAGANGAPSQPELGPLSPAFVEALHDPMVTLGLGRVPSPVEVKIGAAAEARAARMALPSSYDLRTEGRLTPVQDQGAYSTCWAFANVAALESKLMPADPAPDYSEDNLVRRSGYFSTVGRRYDQGGYDFMAIAYFARWAGPVDEASDPYDGEAGANGTVKHVQDVAMIPGRATALNNDLVKQLVMENGALSVGMWMDQSAYMDYSTNSYFDPVAEGENHGVCIVGWDDDYSKSNFGASWRTPQGNGAFLVRNSWGDGFGDGGYFWVSYYDKSFAAEQGLGGLGGMSSYSDIEGADNYSAEYQHDKLGVTAHTGYGSTRAWGASRFTATADQTIAAASFYTLSAGTRYQVWAGRSLRALKLRASGTTALPGYVTAPLTSTLRVYQGRPFVVAVRLDSPGEGHPLAIEYPRASVGAGSATARKGQSFISRNGTTWTDITSVYRRSNVCLKAFAQ